MSRPDFKTARRHLTGNMPMGENRMADFKCEVWRKVPMDWIVEQLAAWPQTEQQLVHQRQSGRCPSRA